MKSEPGAQRPGHAFNKLDRVGNLRPGRYAPGSDFNPTARRKLRLAYRPHYPQPRIVLNNIARGTRQHVH
jgi:hypothetical protein